MSVRNKYTKVHYIRTLENKCLLLDIWYHCQSSILFPILWNSIPGFLQRAALPTNPALWIGHPCSCGAHMTQSGQGETGYVDW